MLVLKTNHPPSAFDVNVGAGPGNGIIVEKKEEKKLIPFNATLNEAKTESPSSLTQAAQAFKKAHLPIDLKELSLLVDSIAHQLKSPTRYFQLGKLHPSYNCEGFTHKNSISVYVFDPNARTIGQGAEKRLTRAARLVFQGNNLMKSQPAARAQQLGSNDAGFVYQVKLLKQIKKQAVKDTTISICHLLDARLKPEKENLDASYTSVIYMKLYGCNLDELLKKNIPREDLLELLPRLLLSTLKQLQWLNLQGIVHRDIKGRNIFCDGSHGAVLGDFGRPGVKTLMYLSPELTDERDSATHKSDIWALGATFLGLINGTGRTMWSELLHYTMMLVRFVNKCQTTISANDSPMGTITEIRNIIEKISTANLSLLGPCLTSTSQPLLNEITAFIDKLLKHESHQDLSLPLKQLFGVLTTLLNGVWTNLAKEVEALGSKEGATEIANVEEFLTTIVGHMVHPNPSIRPDAKDLLARFGDRLESLANEFELPERVYKRIEEQYKIEFKSDEKMPFSPQQIPAIVQKARELISASTELESTVAFEGEGDFPTLHVRKLNDNVIVSIAKHPHKTLGIEKYYFFNIEFSPLGNPYGWWSLVEDDVFKALEKDEYASQYFLKNSANKTTLWKRILEIRIDRTLIFSVGNALIEQLIALNENGAVHGNLTPLELITEVEKRAWTCRLTSTHPKALNIIDLEFSARALSPERWRTFARTGALPMAEPTDDVWGAGLILAMLVNHSCCCPLWQELLKLHVDCINFKRKWDGNEFKIEETHSESGSLMRQYIKLFEAQSPSNLARLSSCPILENKLVPLFVDCKRVMVADRVDRALLEAVHDLEDTLARLIEEIFKSLELPRMLIDDSNFVYRQISIMVNEMLQPDPTKRPDYDKLVEYRDWFDKNRKRV